MMPNLPAIDQCYGCGACVNICPVSALELGYSDIFLFYNLNETLCIGCKKCESACPSLNPTFDNLEMPPFYAYCADDETRSVSSSGGMFTSLARFALQQGGVAWGAAFDDSLVLRHQFADNEDDLDKFRGSKYLQSNVGDCYKTIKKQLDAGQYVLFVGTPCQVAALRGVLGQPYDNLLLVDLLCHGTPSQLFFDKYVEEIADGRSVKDVSFRDKRFGWSWSHIVTSFTDGSEHVGSVKQKNKDPYMLAFNKNLMMRSTCYDCPFCDYPRQGDITIGDLWESAKLDPASNDKKGTSFVFLNNEKGIRVYETLERDAVYSNRIERTPEQYRTIPNRVYRITKPSPHRARFLDLFESRGFSSAVKESLNGKYEIGLATVLYGNNIGSVLTYWSFYHVLTDMGYTVRTFEKPLDASLKDHGKSKEFVKHNLPNYAAPKRYKSVMDMRVLNNMCDMFIVGSDQIWLESMSNIRGDIFFLQYVTGMHKKIAYASSFGGSGARGSADYYDHLRYYLDKFDCITCREDDGISFANETLGLKRHVDFALDPVFLCDMKHFDELCNKGTRFSDEPFVSAYIVRPNKRMADALNHIKAARSLEQIRCAIHLFDPKKTTDLTPFDPLDSFPIEDTLRSLREADMVVTDSYHGVCFSILFKKDFVVVPRDFKDRYVTLLGRLGLEDRIIENDLSNLTDEIAKDHIDYDKVYEKLEPLVQDSKKLLEGALQAETGNRHLTDIDIAMDYISAQQKTIDTLKEQLEAQIESNKDIDKRVRRFENTWKKIQKSALYRLYKRRG